jgi:hypothetical protein
MRGMACGRVLLAARASADVEVVLAVVAVVAEVQDLVVGQAAHDWIGVALSGNADPECGAAGAGVAEVLLDGIGVVGEGAGDALGQAPFGLEPLPAVQDLLAGVDAQVGLGEPSLGQGCIGLLGLVGVLKDGDQEALGVGRTADDAVLDVGEPGASIARTCSTLRSSTFSSSRSPSPSRTATRYSSNSSTSPAARYCWTTLAPPPSGTSRPTPSGCSSLWSGPATYPSNDIAS